MEIRWNNSKGRWLCAEGKRGRDRARVRDGRDPKRPYTRHKGEACAFCAFIPQHPCQLDVDHIDGNHSNNDPTNLQTLCANCHRLKTQNERS